MKRTELIKAASRAAEDKERKATKEADREKKRVSEAEKEMEALKKKKKLEPDLQKQVEFDYAIEKQKRAIKRARDRGYNAREAAVSAKRTAARVATRMVEEHSAAHSLEVTINQPRETFFPLKHAT